MARLKIFLIYSILFSVLLLSISSLISAEGEREEFQPLNRKTDNPLPISVLDEISSLKNINGLLECVPGEIIVKLKEGGSKDPVLEKYSVRRKVHTKILERLERKYGLKDACPVFEDLHKKLKGENKSLRELEKEVRARFPKRAKRIPKVAEKVDILPMYVLKTKQKNIMDLCAKLKEDPRVVYAEPNYKVKAFSTYPDDPFFEKQWALNNTGQPYPVPGGVEENGTPDCDIDAPEAWDEQTGTDAVIVAVIDTGVDYNHPDIAQNMWTGLNGEHGYDFRNGDPDPMDDNGHGTHCSGIIAAVGNNGIGISGINWNSKIMAVKFLGATGSGSITDGVEAIYYAVGNGARVLSNSWGLMWYSETLQEVINFAHNEGVIFVAAAGNSDTDKIFYPAGHDHAVAVAATDSNDEKASFSNYGYWIDASAPGVDILSLRANGTDMYGDGGHIYEDDYYICSGTSMACPHVAGLAALVLSEYPDANNIEATDRIMATSDSVGAGNLLGMGRINAYGAMIAQPQPAIAIREVTPIPQNLVNNLYEVALVIALEDLWVDAEKVTAVLGCNNPNVNIIQNTCNYGSIAVHEEKDNSQFPFRFQIEDYYNNLEIEFELTININYSITAVKKIVVNTSVVPGWPKNIGGFILSSPTLGDLDGDDGLEIVIGRCSMINNDDSVYAFHGDGTMVEGWPKIVTDGIIGSTPALGDIDEDGDFEVVISSHFKDSNGGFTYAWHHNGDLVEGNWPQLTEGGESSFPASALADLDKDGKLEIITDSGWKTHVWNSDGSLVEGWPVNTPSDNQTPVVSDINGDGNLDIVVTAYNNGSFGLYAYNKDGTVLPGWPQELLGFLSSQLPSPAVGDLDNDGDLELIAVSCERIEHGCYKTHIWIFHHDGTLENHWPVAGLVWSSPAIGNFDSDPDLEIVTAVQKSVYVWNMDGTLVNGWPQETRYLIEASPALCDIDNDGNLEIFIGSDDGKVYAWHSDGTLLPGWPKTIGYFIMSSIAIGDINGDGYLDLVIGSFDGYVHAWCLRTPCFTNAIEWGTFGKNMKRDKCYRKRIGYPLLKIKALLNGFYNPSTQNQRQAVIDVILRNVNDNDKVYNYSAVQLDKNGNVEIPLHGLPRDSSLYEVVIHDLNHLDVKSKETYNLGEANCTIDFTDPDNVYRNDIALFLEIDGRYSLRGGNANGDEYVNSIDFYIWHNASGTSIGDPGYDRRADFNGDGVIDGGDLLIWISNSGFQSYINDGFITGNRPPVFDSLPNQSVHEGEELIFTVNATDPDGDEITYSVDPDTLPFGASFNPVTKTFNWVPSYLQAGEYTVTFCASDDLSFSMLFVSITVNNLETPDLVPTEITYDPEAIRPGDSVRFDTGISNVGDADSGVFNVEWYVNGVLEVAGSHSGIPAGETVMDGNSDFSWTAPEELGEYEIKFVVDADNHVRESNEDNNEVSIIVEVVSNRPPVLEPIGNKIVCEMRTLTFTVIAADPDGDIPSLLAEGLPEGASFIDNNDGTGIFTWTPTYEQAGDYEVTFIASDAEPLTDSETITITVNNVNRWPVIAEIEDQTINEGELLELSVTATDPDGDIPSLSANNMPEGANFIDNGDGTGTFSWTPAYEQSGNYWVMFKASDGRNFDLEFINIDVIDINRPPVADAGLDQTVAEDTLVTLDGSGSYDPDNDPIAFWWEQISGSWVELSDPSAVNPTFTAPCVDAEESLVFELAVTDGDLPDIDTVTINVNNSDNSKSIYIYDEFPKFVATVYGNNPPTEWSLNETDGDIDDNVYYMKIVYTGDTWGGLCFLNAEGNWDGPGMDFSGAISCKFMARADIGAGESVSVFIRIGDENILEIPLINVWTEYEIPLDEYDLTNIRKIFSIGVPGPLNTFYFDKIRFMFQRENDNPQVVNITGSIFDNSSRLSVDGQEFQVKGVGYSHVYESQHYNIDFSMISTIGGNTLRTWAQQNAIFSTLGALQENNMKILMGFWLPRPGIEGIDVGFYLDELNKQAVRNQLIRFINVYKDHPTVLAWLLGNEVYYRLIEAGASQEEMEVFLEFLDELCLMVKELDPNHPVGYAGGGLYYIIEYVPSLDFYGCNMYGYLSRGEIDRYLTYCIEIGYDKPLILTEFGTNGPWEPPFNNNYDEFNQPYYDRDKGQWIADRWEIIDSNYGLTLGGCVFNLIDCNEVDGEDDLRWGIVDKDRSPRRQFIDLAKAWGGAGYIYVDTNYIGPEEGTKNEPFNTIQEGINAASSYMTIAVAQGECYENIQLRPNVWLEGGWDGWVAGWLERNHYDYKSIIDGGGEGTVVRAADNTTVDGFSITGSGNASQDWYASGVWSQNNNVKIVNNILYDNNRGISCWNSSGNTVRNNILYNHQTDTMYCFSSNPEIVNNTIAYNTDSMGRSTCGIYGHDMEDGIRIINNIIADNEVGIGITSDTEPYIAYNDVWGNSVANYEGIDDPTGEEGNISEYPSFVDFNNKDFHLSPGSPCIDAGAPWSDYHNEPQPNGGRINMGAYGDTEQATTSAIKLEANHILACQFNPPSPDDPHYNARGAINDIYAASGEYTWIVPGENAMAILGLLVACGVTRDSRFMDGAHLCADYLVRVQADDGSWYNQYYFDLRVDNGKDARHTAEVMLAFYFLGYHGDRYESMKKGAEFLLACQDVANKGGQDDGLVCGGKDSTGNYHTWRWTSDNSYAYQALGAACKWAEEYGDYDFAYNCRVARDKILNGINTYLKDPDTAVWYQVVYENGGHPTDWDPSWINYAPVMLDVPAACDPQEVGDWIHDTFQQEDGSCIGYDQGHIRKYPGLTFQASLCWIDTEQLAYKEQGVTWAEGSDLWQLTEDGNGIKGGWIDWIEISPNQGETAPWWERFIDTSAYSIFIWTGGFDFNVNIPPE